MKKFIIIILLMTALVVGCSAEIKEIDSDYDKELDLFKDKGNQTIMDILPKEYLEYIPSEEISNASAEIKDNICTIWVTWETDKSLDEVASMVSNKLGYELELDEGKWKGNAPQGTSLSNVTLNTSNSLKGLQVSYMIDVNQTTENRTLLTESFPLACFDILPDSVQQENAFRKVEYGSDNWVFTLTWTYEQSEGQKLADELLNMYAKMDNYSQKKIDNGDEVSFNINNKDTMSIQHISEEDKSIIKTAYTYKIPGHLESTSMKSLLDDPTKSLLGNYLEDYQKILGETFEGLALSFYPEEKILAYEMTVAESENVQEIVRKAESILKGEFALNNKGQYRFNSEKISYTIKPGNGLIGLIIEEEVDASFIHPYIHDVYPVEYQPEMPPALRETPFSMETQYHNDKETDYIVLTKTWRFKEESQSKEVWGELDNKLQDLHGYNAYTNQETDTINCTIKEYGYECNLFKKGDHWIISTAFRYQINN